VEDRVAREHTERPGAALTALVAILAITAAWWALALWPVGAVEPAWLVRTRAACFGSRPGGLPDAGGWILLVGEPLGVLAMLGAVWGRSLRRDLRWIAERRAWRLAATSIAALVVVATASLGVRVARVWATGRATVMSVGAVPRRIDRAPPVVALVDQRGQRTSLADSRGQSVLLTFAYGHCSNVCPSIVHDLQVARRTANRPDIPLVIVTLDPWRDTPERLQMLAHHWGLGPNDRMLSGSVADVESALDTLGIGRRRDETTGDIDHATATMILDDRGRIAWRIDGAAFGVADLLRRSR
jgi:cytochrome oxidase Cu insertion factor (SCO1/SenC/PrrC family)